MNHLTEDRIKSLALQFLKGYYKFRPRTGETEVSTDMKAEGGIIIDGYLKFPKSDGKAFIATIEATSFEKIDEVQYTIQRNLIFWDCLAFSAVVTAFIWSYLYSKNLYTVQSSGWFESVSILLLCLLSLWLVYFFIAKKFSRYRYIYAIEQFKRFHADEQWIALAEDVFENPENPYLKELKHQCVYNGFGLMTVGLDEETQLQITPARQEIFNKKRRQSKIIGRISNERALAQMKKVGSLWSVWKEKIWESTNENNLFRYTRSFFYQVVLSTLGLAILGGIYFRQYQDHSLNYVNEEKYEKEMKELAESAEPEIDEVDFDSSQIVDSEGKASPYLGFEDEIIPTDLSFEVSNAPELLIALDFEGNQIYDCARFYNFKGSLFFVQDGLYPQLAAAKKRMATLNRRGIKANLLWLGCFSSRSKTYMVYYDLIYDTKAEANEQRQQYSRAIERRNVNPGDGLIRTIFKK